MFFLGQVLSPNIFEKMAGTDRVDYLSKQCRFFYFVPPQEKLVDAKKNMSEMHRCKLNMRSLSSAKRIRFLF